MELFGPAKEKTHNIASDIAENFRLIKESAFKQNQSVNTGYLSNLFSNAACASQDIDKSLSPDQRHSEKVVYEAAKIMLDRGLSVNDIVLEHHHIEKMGAAAKENPGIRGKIMAAFLANIPMSKATKIAISQKIIPSAIRTNRMYENLEKMQRAHDESTKSSHQTNQKNDIKNILK